MLAPPQALRPRLVARVGLVLLQLACITLLADPTAVRSFLYRQLYPLVSVSVQEINASPGELATRGYTQDSIDGLGAFQVLARAITAPATTDEQRLRLLGNAVYRMRAVNAPLIDGGREQGIHAMLVKMQNGERGLCGHNTLILAALWRSLGGDFRQIRFTENDNAAWFAAHYGIEVYLNDWRRWLYYDISLNGFATDDRGEPLSLNELNEQLAAGHDVSITGSSQARDWDTTMFLNFLRAAPRQVYSLNNELLPLEPDRRFGRLHFAHPLLSRLPRPLDRIVDAITGDARPRLVLSRPTPPPASQASMHLSASPVGLAPFP